VSFGLMEGEIGVEVGFVVGKGRALFARKAFKDGDIIMRERPLVSLQFPENKVTKQTIFFEKSSLPIRKKSTVVPTV
jgi:hypothetical protein